MTIPNILSAFRNGEGFDYLDQEYETIDYEKHNQYVEENEKF
jgi:hypothetical protein